MYILNLLDTARIGLQTMHQKLLDSLRAKTEWNLNS